MKTFILAGFKASSRGHWTALGRGVITHHGLTQLQPILCSDLSLPHRPHTHARNKPYEMILPLFHAVHTLWYLRKTVGYVTFYSMSFWKACFYPKIDFMICSIIWSMKTLTGPHQMGWVCMCVWPPQCVPSPRPGRWLLPQWNPLSAHPGLALPWPYWLCSSWALNVNQPTTPIVFRRFPKIHQYSPSKIQFDLTSEYWTWRGQMVWHLNLSVYYNVMGKSTDNLEMDLRGGSR